MMGEKIHVHEAVRAYVMERPQNMKGSHPKQKGHEFLHSVAYS